MKSLLKKIILSGICFFSVVFQVYGVDGGSWKTEKGIHFVVYYTSQESSSWARSVLRASEMYYRRIADNINYSRYRNFWIWDDRVNIMIYPDRETFLKNTNQPQWSKGSAFRDDTLSKTKMIVTYKQEDGFLDGILPHEISHLILWDFIGFDRNIPVWFNEGVAQLQESQKRSIVRPFIQKIVLADQHMPIDLLMQTDVRTITDPKQVAIFYGQSLSIIDFLIAQYGSSKFGELCVVFRDTKNLEEALRKTYMFDFRSFVELEKKWLRYVKK